MWATVDLCLVQQYEDNNIVHGASSTLFFCGNFGILLLHPAWTATRNDYGQEALNLPTKKKVEVTMMRAAPKPASLYAPETRPYHRNNQSKVDNNTVDEVSI